MSFKARVSSLLGEPPFGLTGIGEGARRLPSSILVLGFMTPESWSDAWIFDYSIKFLDSYILAD